MRRLIGLLAIFSLTLTACAGLLANPAPSSPPAPACVVRYSQIHPQAYLGEDGCGNRWLLVPGDTDSTVKCLYWQAADGVLLEIPCPAEGDTLGVE